jgi:hypothetical protein
MVDQSLLKVGNANLDWHVAQTEQDHSRMWSSIAEDEIAEVLVIGQYDALISKRDCQNIPVVQRLGMVASADGDVVSRTIEECRKAEWETLSSRNLTAQTVWQSLSV